MILRQMPTSMDATIVAAIDARLTAIAGSEDVAIALAIESGSRAWGFPSPDSDYDCRFVFIRRAEHYLSPWPRRDVIEVALDAELDINGWDLGKALKLLLKGNAVLIEWLTSPIIYSADAQFRDEFLALARRTADRALIARHYLHLGERQRRSYFGDGKDVPLKKIFYALRPAASLRWLRLHPGEAIAPMHFPRLLAECEPPAALAGLIADLLARKAVTRELGSGEVPATVRAFIDTEFQRAHDHPLGPERPPAEGAKADAEAFFLASLARLGPAGGGNRG